jgi:hypothetical protein
MVALKGDKEIGDKIDKIIGKLAEANDLKGVIDVADSNPLQFSIARAILAPCGKTVFSNHRRMDCEA